MVTCRYRQEVLSKETMRLGQSTSLRLHSQPKEPQVTREPLRRPTLLERQVRDRVYLVLNIPHFVKQKQIENLELGHQGVRSWQQHPVLLRAVCSSLSPPVHVVPCIAILEAPAFWPMVR